jgi:sterol 24-C-methyltransferase
MYIPPVMDLKQSLTQNQVLFERKMCADLAIKKTDKVLDIGCGRGRVANHVHELTGAKVYGFNIDPTQLNFAKLYTDSRGNDCHFQRWDINSLPFPYEDNFFDAIYHIQVFSLSQDLNLLFKEINRILKPGGRLSCLDWVVLDKYDKNNKEHVSLMKRVKPLIGAIGCPHNKEYAAAMENAGFELIIDANASVGGLQYQLIDNADSFYANVEKWIKFLCKYKIFPAYFERLFNRFTLDGQAFVEMDKKELCTSCYHFVGKKKEIAARN